MRPFPLEIYSSCSSFLCSHLPLFPWSSINLLYCFYLSLYLLLSFSSKSAGRLLIPSQFHYLPTPRMYSLLILVSSLLLVTGAIAQGYDYGGSNSPSYGSGSGSGGSGSSSSAGSESSSVNSPTSCASASKAMPHTHISKETSTPDGSAKVHIVKVSNKKGNLTFEPNDLTAAVGSLVQFHFYPKVGPCMPHSHLTIICLLTMVELESLRRGIHL